MSGGRINAAIPLALLLCACNQVISTEPWFTQEDSLGAPKLRDGLWVRLDDNDCRFDEKKPAERWPDCAKGIVVRGDRLLGIEWEDDGEGPKARRDLSGWDEMPTLIANGNPLILQFQVVESLAPDTDQMADEGKSDTIRPYFYVAIRPTASDDSGQVTRFDFWSVQCGPLPEPAKSVPAEPSEVASSVYVTERPFPGLTVSDNSCAAESKDALHGAAVLSEALEDGSLDSAHWVRDGYR